MNEPRQDHRQDRRRLCRVADWVAAQLDLVEQTSPSSAPSSAPSAQIVRVGHDQVLIHAPRGRSFSLTLRDITSEITSEVDHD